MTAQALAERPKPASPLRLIAVPEPGDVMTYQRLEAIQLAAKALVTHIDTYRATPAHPVNNEYRESRMARIEEDIADLRKVLGDA